MAEAIVFIMVSYALLGAVFAAAFIVRGIERVDPTAHGAPWSFRLLILPGAMALWPLLLSRWRRAPKSEARR